MLLEDYPAMVSWFDLDARKQYSKAFTASSCGGFPSHYVINKSYMSSNATWYKEASKTLRGKRNVTFLIRAYAKR